MLTKDLLARLKALAEKIDNEPQYDELDSEVLYKAIRRLEKLNAPIPIKYDYPESPFTFR